MCWYVYCSWQVHTSLRNGTQRCYIWKSRTCISDFPANHRRLSTVLKWGHEHLSLCGISSCCDTGQISVNGNNITIPVVSAYLQSLFKHASVFFNGTGIANTPSKTAAEPRRGRRSEDEDGSGDDKSFFSVRVSCFSSNSLLYFHEFHYCRATAILCQS